MMALIFTWISLAFASQDCPALDGAVEFEGEAGKRRIALVVGVGDYLAEVENERGEMVNIDLKGPPNDAVRMRTVLVERYGFPAANVCMLVDSDATRANFLAAWDRHLMRAEENDIAVFFFAGHGSQVVDTTGRADETDGMDETLMFHDSRAGSDELVDDDFNALLHGLNGRTRNGTILIDACNSGSATRGVGVRQVDPITEARLAPRPQLAAAAGGEHDYSPETLPGFVIVTGAEDGTVALERGGQGVFTNALLRALEDQGDGSWEQISQIIPQWIDTQQSFQRATFEGALERKIFGSTVFARGGSWQVIEVDDDEVRFRGPAMPGWSDGAVVQIWRDGESKYQARARIDKIDTLYAHGTFIGSRRKAVRPGYFAVLESPGADATTIRVRFDGVVPLAREIRKAIADDNVLRNTVLLVDTAADFDIRPKGPSALQIWGSEGVLRNDLQATTQADAKLIAQTLGLHARQRTLLELSGEIGGLYSPGTLDVRILRDPRVPDCSKTAYTEPTRAQSYASVPMCTPVRLEVKLAKPPQQPLYLGILYLANDGNIIAWPRGDTQEVLREVGQSHVEELGVVRPPLRVPDRILVFGTHEPIRWNKLENRVYARESVGVTRSVSRQGGGLQDFLDSHVSGTRGIEDEEAEDATGWTASFLALEVTGDPAMWTDSQLSSSQVCKERLAARECQ